MTHVYAMAVVGNLEELEAAILDEDFNGSRTSVDGILDQLFQCMHGSHDDLSRSDLIDDIGIESLDLLDRGN